MGERRRYVQKSGVRVVAVQLALDTQGFTYRKWGDTQTCKPGDWLVDNDGDVYTVDRDSFAHSYRAVGRGLYEKVTPVWAEVAREAGEIRTKEGVTRYAAGAYLVSNDPDGRDCYAVDAEHFERTYELAR